MRLTKKKAIEITIELWTELAETGELKEDWDGWKKYGEMDCDCALCEYDNQQDGYCEHCPYHEIFGNCESPSIKDDPTIYDKWRGAKTPKTRKKYASLFLKQLRRLK